VQLREGLTKTIEYFDRLLRLDAKQERLPLGIAKLGSLNEVQP
jgi:hypothetical protein